MHPQCMTDKRMVVIYNHSFISHALRVHVFVCMCVYVHMRASVRVQCLCVSVCVRVCEYVTHVYAWCVHGVCLCMFVDRVSCAWMNHIKSM